MQKRIRHFLHYRLRPLLKEKERKSIPIILREVVDLYRLYGIFPMHYFGHALYLREIEVNVTQFVPKKIIYAWQKQVNGDRRTPATKDKALFRSIMNAHGVPCVNEMFVVDATGAFLDRDGAAIDGQEALRRLEEAGGRAFLKPVDGMQGQDTRIFDLGEQSLDTIADGRHRILVQPVLVQHPVLAALYPHAVNTIRIDTLVTGEDCISNVAVLRLGAGGSVIDNASRGGLVVPIDLATGKLRPRGRRKPHFDTRFYTRHPDTGVVFAGYQLPFWPEVLALVQAGARALLPMRSLGWDIAITPEGPLAIETNGDWNTDAFQLGQGLRDTPIGRMAMEAWQNDPEPRIVP